MGQGRRYEKTHPWITFDARALTSASGMLWYQLGRVTALCEHISHSALRPELAKSLHDIYLIKGAQATTAIEGNTLTEDQVREVVEGGSLRPSKEYLAQEVRNVVTGYNDVGRDLQQNHTPDVSPERLQHINGLLQRDLDVDDHVVPGEYRLTSVGVGTYLAPPAEDVDYLVKQLTDWLTGPELAGQAGQELPMAILRAILAHLYVAWIHPFGDGNGRTARMLEFQILVSSGVPSPAAHLLSNHYNATRDNYYRQLERTSKRPDGDILPFLQYALQGFVDGLEEQLDLMRRDLERLVWRDQVDRAYGFDCSKTDQRRKRLASLLFDRAGTVTASAIFRSEELLGWYADKTTKTLTRDLNDLAGHALVVRAPGGWRARVEIVRGMRPEAQF